MKQTSKPVSIREELLRRGISRDDMITRKYFRRIASFCIVPALIAATSARATVLTYDHSVINLVAGQTVTIGATLTAPGLQTDALGNLLPIFPFGQQPAIFVSEEQTITSLFIGSPNSFFCNNL